MKDELRIARAVRGEPLKGLIDMLIREILQWFMDIWIEGQGLRIDIPRI